MGSTRGLESSMKKPLSISASSTLTAEEAEKAFAAELEVRIIYT